MKNQSIEGLRVRRSWVKTKALERGIEKLRADLTEAIIRSKQGLNYQGDLAAIGIDFGQRTLRVAVLRRAIKQGLLNEIVLRPNDPWEENRVLKVVIGKLGRRSSVLWTIGGPTLQTLLDFK
ncbi:hypothetical protein COT42_04175 [Candidatus Saganbacteria bacterium CG08_land_8_20_14_0_20_45_16]|uniref:Uncharacterized protein n=1 Tax=Candidatus Saganbacteria bacterium CG08_land_8_20_14_0_20_45_16 TaxID=2014293 RepID=A0A2H0XY49_UNCSA|nr:MAG: hypothetical protein COT42_04175 [Candidatus Saganbacteria bacterium CG08_land_8_20_14_0_20_45_16]